MPMDFIPSDDITCDMSSLSSSNIVKLPTYPHHNFTPTIEHGPDMPYAPSATIKIKTINVDPSQNLPNMPSPPKVYTTRCITYTRLRRRKWWNQLDSYIWSLYPVLTSHSVPFLIPHPFFLFHVLHVWWSRFLQPKSWHLANPILCDATGCHRLWQCLTVVISK